MSANHEADLFTQQDSSYLGDCPICCLPLPIDRSKSGLMGCCSQLICLGCDYANYMRENEQGLEHRCAYCREPVPETSSFKNVKKRAKKNDPVAMSEMGKRHCHEGDYKTGLQYYSKAAELGDANAHYQLSVCIAMARVLRRIQKRKFAIWKRQPSEVIPRRGTILELKSGTVVTSGEQRNISSLLPTLDIKIHLTNSGNFMQVEMRVKKIMPVLSVHIRLL